MCFGIVKEQQMVIERSVTRDRLCAVGGVGPSTKGGLWQDIQQGREVGGRCVGFVRGQDRHNLGRRTNRE